MSSCNCATPFCCSTPWPINASGTSPIASTGTSPRAASRDCCGGPVTFICCAGSPGPSKAVATPRWLLQHKVTGQFLQTIWQWLPVWTSSPEAAWQFHLPQRAAALIHDVDGLSAAIEELRLVAIRRAPAPQGHAPNWIVDG